MKNTKLSSRDTRVTTILEAKELGELVGQFYELQKKSRWDDRLITAATGAGAVGMAGAGVGDALAEDGKITLRQSKGHFRALIKRAEKAGASPRARYKGKKLTPNTSAKIVDKLRSRMSRAPVKAKRMGGGKLGLILGGLVGASLPPEKRVMMARGLIGSAILELSAGKRAIKTMSYADRQYESSKLLDQVKRGLLAKRLKKKGAKAQRAKKRELSTPDAYVMIDGKKYHEFARTRENDPFKGLGHDPNVAIARNYGEFKKAKGIANKLVRKTKSSNTIINDLGDLIAEKKGSQGVLKTSNGGEYRIARGNRNSVRVYHKGAPRNRRRKRFYEKKKFRDNAAGALIAGGTAAGFAGGRKLGKLETRVSAKNKLGQPTSIQKELVRAPLRDLAAYRQSSANRSVKRKYGARSVSKTLNSSSGVQKIYNPVKAGGQWKDYTGDMKKATEQVSRFDKWANRKKRSPGSVKDAGEKLLRTQQSWSQSGMKKMKTPLPPAAKTKVANANEALAKKMTKADARLLDVLHDRTQPVKKIKSSLNPFKPSKYKKRAMVKTHRSNFSLLQRAAKLAKKIKK